MSKAPQTPPTALSFNILPKNKPVPTNINEVKAVMITAKMILIFISSPKAPATSKVIVACAMVITIIGKV